MVVEGVTFACWHTGVLQSQWRSADGRLAAGHRSGRDTYYARVDGSYLKTRFRTLENAMRAAVKAAE